MAKQTEPSLPVFDEPAKPKTRLVNRNARLKATAKIVDVLSGFDGDTRSAIMRAVNELMNEQPELPLTEDAK